MNKKIIIVTGYVAAGKTTFSLRLSRELGIPCFNKDLLKIALNRSIPVTNRAESKRLSAATFDAMAFITKKFMETGFPLIIEANFVMGENHNNTREGDVLKALVERYGYQSLTYLFLGDTQVLYRRFIERDRLPERGQANQMWETMDDKAFEQYISPLGDFNIGGKIMKVDTSEVEGVDFEYYINEARLFLDSSG